MIRSTEPVVFNFSKRICLFSPVDHPFRLGVSACGGGTLIWKSGTEMTRTKQKAQSAFANWAFCFVGRE